MAQEEHPAQGSGEEAALGQSSLPLSKIKKIIKLDDEIRNCTNSSAFVVSVATEMFVQFLVRNGYKGAQKDKRKTLQYKDLANVVSHMDNLEFLSDLVPKTMPYKKVIEKKKANQERETGQLTLREQKPGKKANGHTANGKVVKPASSRSRSNSKSNSPSHQPESPENPNQSSPAKDTPGTDAMEE